MSEAEVVTCVGVKPEPPPAHVPRKLTPEEVEEARKTAQEIFDYFDSDKSGYIDAKDMENFYRKFNNVEENLILLTEDQIKEYTAEFTQQAAGLDTNADAKVSFDEMYNSMIKQFESGIESGDLV